MASTFHERLDEQGIAGGSLWFVDDGVVLARELHGLADRGTDRPVDEDTIYHWASITKTLTGIAILQLRDRGRLSLDDPLVHYLPELEQVHNPHGPMDAITIRHVMSHSAGFRNPTWPWGGDQPWHPHEPTEWSQLAAMMPYTEVLFEPGTRYSYSNPGIIFLGRIIEILSGDDYEVYMDKNVLDPLGMSRSYFDLTPYHLLADRSNNYTVRGDSLIANGLDFDTGITTSNGGLNAPVPDMIRYLSFLTGSCEERACREVLDRSSLEEMWVGQHPLPQDGTVNDVEAARDSIGLTFFVHSTDRLRLIGHTGSQKAFVSFICVDPATGAGAILALNTDRASSEESRGQAELVLREVRERVIERVFPLFRSKAAGSRGR